MSDRELERYLADLGISADGALPASQPSPRSASHVQDSPQTVLTRFLQGLVARLGEEGSYGLEVRVTEEEGHAVLEAEITGERAAALPGRDGATLQAIEVLSYAVLTRRFGPSDLKIRVDAGGYRARQAAALSGLAQRLAAQVAKSGEAHELQPMPASERRIIHVSLKGHPLVTTESRGEGHGRHLVILPR